MTEYSVHFVSPASTSVKVKADSLDAAMDAAHGEVHVTLCHQCDRAVDLAGEWEATHVFNEDTGEMVWEEKP